VAFRSFRDSRGRSWSAWDVRPQLVERRRIERRRAAAPLSFADRRANDRRRASSPRAPLGAGLDNGWLCFEGAAEKRRLAPVPEDWTDCRASRLESYLEQAQPVKKTRAS
jgi:hypothetical protein